MHNKFSQIWYPLATINKWLVNFITNSLIYNMPMFSQLLHFNQNQLERGHLGGGTLNYIERFFVIVTCEHQVAGRGVGFISYIIGQFKKKNWLIDLSSAKKLKELMLPICWSFPMQECCLFAAMCNWGESSDISYIAILLL